MTECRFFPSLRLLHNLKRGAYSKEIGYYGESMSVEMMETTRVNRSGSER